MWKSFHRLAGVKADELDVIVATQATTAATETEDIRMLRDAVLGRSIGEGALFKYLWGVGVSVFVVAMVRAGRCRRHRERGQTVITYTWHIFF